MRPGVTRHRPPLSPAEPWLSHSFLLYAPAMEAIALENVGLAGVRRAATLGHEERRLRPVFQLEFPQDGRNVVLDGLLGGAHAIGNLPVAEPFRERVEYPPL